ncbi:hypothetical protein D915_006053 [Fasciola hepatica]|uniref:H/ACA ribonucleoprotein complex non-core subunit NAF1 n=1 Tax=Fasciola hepatica TaxID=6192 RepID=A0A4E0R8B1_FASHE|nr:hypothetical protein D915_006053 [Fasciola hepatica]
MSSSSSESEGSECSLPLPTVQKRDTTAKSRPPLFTVMPNYVPRIPEKLPSNTPLSVLGTTINVVDGCVIIQSRPNVPTLDAGTSLFLDGGEPLGEIYETFGPVATPLYVVVLPNSPCLVKTNALSKQRRAARKLQSLQTEEVPSDACLPEPTVVSSDSVGDGAEKHTEQSSSDRLSSTDTLVDSLNQSDKDVNVVSGSASCTPSEPEAPAVLSGDVVYFVKSDPELTIPVFYSQLVQMKGSDASWVNDTEPPPEVSRSSIPGEAPATSASQHPAARSTTSSRCRPRAARASYFPRFSADAPQNDTSAAAWMHPNNMTVPFYGPRLQSPPMMLPSANLLPMMQTMSGCSRSVSPQFTPQMPLGLGPMSVFPPHGIGGFIGGPRSPGNAPVVMNPTAPNNYGALGTMQRHYSQFGYGSMGFEHNVPPNMGALRLSVAHSLSSSAKTCTPPAYCSDTSGLFSTNQDHFEPALRGCPSFTAPFRNSCPNNTSYGAFSMPPPSFTRTHYQSPSFPAAVLVTVSNAVSYSGTAISNRISTACPNIQTSFISPIYSSSGFSMPRGF